MTGRRQYPDPAPRDWVLLGISVAFVLSGLVILPKRPDVALPVLTLFGLCAAVFIGTIVRKRRFAALRPISVEVAGGVPIRPLRSRIVMQAMALLGLGGVLLVYGHAAPVFIVLSACFMVAVGGLLALGLLTGYLPQGFLQFDPAGLTVGQRGSSLQLPWDSIALVTIGEINDNPVLLLGLHDVGSVVVSPDHARVRVLGRLIANAAWCGAHVTIMPSLYGIDLPLLVTAIQGYVTDQSARQGLRVPRLSATPD